MADDLEIFINENSVDIHPKTRAAITIQAHNIGDFKEAKATFTNKLTLLNTAKTREALGNVGVIGSEGDFTKDEFARVDIRLKGLSILEKAKARFTSFDGDYNITIFSGNYDLFKSVEGLNLSDLDFTDYRYQYSEYNWKQGNDGFITSGVIFPICEYTEGRDYYFSGFPYDDSEKVLSGVSSGGFGSRAIINARYLLPWFYKHTLIKEIIEQAGFTLSNELDSDSMYLDTIISGQVPEKFTGFQLGSTYDWADFAPDMSQTDLLKNVLAQHGCIISSVDNVVYITKIQTLYKNQGNAHDWSGKIDITEPFSVLRGAGLAVNNYINYANDKDVWSTTFGYDPTNGDANMVSDNKQLKDIQSIVDLKSEAPLLEQWSMVEQTYNTTGRVVNVYVPYMPVVKFPSPKTTANEGEFSKSPKPTEAIVNIISFRKVLTGGVGFVQFKAKWLSDSAIQTELSLERVNIPYFISQAWQEYAPPLNNTRSPYFDHLTAKSYNLTPEYLKENYFKEFANGTIKDPIVVKARMNLNLKDILSLDRLDENGEAGRKRPVYVHELNGYYYVNRINKFQVGKLTDVELVKL